MDIVWLPKFAAAGWLMDLIDRIPAAEVADFFPADLEGGRYEGRLYRLPYRTDAGLLYYRKDLLDYKYPHYPDLLQVVEQGVLRPPVAQYAQASDILQRYLSAALTDRMSPTAAMQAAAKETRSLLK
ncbi:MAG TPA: extracellular solute-binding protein [Allocoleopsis sp.]